jgi:hypothetical protein
MLGELIGEFSGKISGVRILAKGKTEMTIQGTGKILGLEATYASTGVFSRTSSGVLVEVGNGLISSVGHDVATVHFRRVSISAGKGRRASFREASYYQTESEKLASLNHIVGVAELETQENGDWILKIWEWK